MTFEAIIEEILHLPLERRKELIGIIVDSLIDTSPPDEAPSLLELEGLGKEIWQGIDAQAYVNQLRDEWDQSV
jgi:hypothetical protein